MPHFKGRSLRQSEQRHAMLGMVAAKFNRRRITERAPHADAAPGRRKA